MEYFKHFPSIEYGDTQGINIMLRLKIKEYLKNNIYIYEEYEVKDYERADIIANNYYGNYKYTWLIYYANDIFDPIRDWFFSYDEFNRYIENKYTETVWQPSAAYFEGNKVLYGDVPYRCKEYHISDSPILGFLISETQFKCEVVILEQNYLVNDYAFFYNSLDRANGKWLKIISNNGVVIEVDGELPGGCNYVEMYAPNKFEIYNNGIIRPGFEIANQRIHEFRDSHDMVVDFDSWYYDVFVDIINEASYNNYDFTQHGTNRQIVRLVDYHDNYYYIEMKLRFNYNTGLYEPYYTQEDITSYLDASVKQNYLIQDFTIRTKNIIDPPDWVKESCFYNSTVGWVDNITHNIIVPKSYLGKRTITKYQYELDENERKRHIKLIDKRYVPQILYEFKKLLGSNY